MQYLGALQGQPMSARWTMADPYGTAESSEAVASRATGWWLRTIVGEVGGGTGPAGETVLVVSHGGLIMTLVRGLLGLGLLRCAAGVEVRHCKNTAVSIVEVGDGAGTAGELVRFGDIGHLEDAEMKAVEKNADEAEERMR